MSKHFSFLIYLSLQSVISFSYIQNNPYFGPKVRTLKDDFKDRQSLEMYIFLIEKFNCPQDCFKSCLQEFLSLKEEAKPFLERHKMLRKLYIESCENKEKSVDIERIIEEDSQGLLDVLEKLLVFQDKCHCQK